MSQPEAVSSAICCSVALTSEVGVVVIDCTQTGASPPTATVADLDLAATLRRGASTGGGSRGHAEARRVMPLQYRRRADGSARHGAGQPSLIGLTMSA